MSRTTTLLVLAALAALPASARAQDAEADREERREALRHRVEERFTERVREELKLSNEQSERLRESTRKWSTKRRGIVAEQRRLRQSLAELRRSGGRDAGEEGEKRLRRMLDLRVELAQTYRDELSEIDDFLTVEQRVEFFRLRERLLARAVEQRDRRQEGERARPRPRGGRGRE